MLIVEGPDLVGKTTVAKAMERLPSFQERGMVYRHLSRLPSGFNSPWQYRSLMGRRTIYDRFHMSEPCYCFAREKQTTRLPPEPYRLVDSWLRGLGAVVVLVTADDELIRERHSSREEMYSVEATLRAARAFKLLGDQWLGHPLESGVDYIDDLKPDVDLWFHCTADHPFLDESQLEQIERAWLERQEALDEIIELADDGADFGVF